MTTTDPHPIDLDAIRAKANRGIELFPDHDPHLISGCSAGDALDLIAEVERLRASLDAIRAVLAEHGSEGDAPNCAAHEEGLFCCIDAEHARGAAIRAALDS